MNIKMGFVSPLRLLRPLFALLFMLLATAVLQGQTVKGVVKDQAGNPVAQVNVIVDGTQKGTSTKLDGSYMIHKLPSGVCEITVSHVGYHSVTKQLTVLGDLDYRLDFTMHIDTVSMNTVVVNANPDDHADLVRIPSRTQMLDIKDIQRIPALSVSTLLSTVSGVHVYSEAGMFSTSIVSLRGIGGNTQTGTLVMLDGVPLNKSDGGSVNWNIIDKDRISKMEIIKGPGSALFGSNAMGGVINIITQKPVERLEGKLSASYGTYNTTEAKLHIGGMARHAKSYWRTFVYYRSSDGYINTPDEIILENDSIVVPVFLNEFFAGGLFGFQPAAGGKFEVSANFFRDIRGRGTKIYEDQGSNTSRNTYQTSLRYLVKKSGWTIQTTGYVLREQYFRLNEYYSDGEYKLYEVDATRDDAGIRSVGEKTYSGGGEITGGVEARLGSVEARDTYYTSSDIISNAGSIDVFAAFVQYRKQLRRQQWDLVAGIRYDVAHFYNAAFSIDKPSYSIVYFSDFQFDHVKDEFWGALNPKFTLQFRATPSVRFYCSLAKGFRAPVLDDLCRTERSNTGLRVANPTLRPEHVLNFESGTDLKIFKSLTVAISSYASLGRDFMHMLSTGDSVNLGYTIAPIYQISNISRVRILGVEADFSAYIGKWAQIKGNYTFNQSTITNYEPNSPADPDLTGKYLANLPSHRFTIGVNSETPWFNISVFGNYSGARWIRDDNAFDPIYLLAEKYKPYFSVNLKCWRSFGPVEASLDVDNATNVIYINSKGYKSPGRMLFLRVTYSIRKKEHYDSEKFLE